MERLNALEWADGLAFSAFGIRVGIRVTVPEVLPPLLERFPPGWKPSGTSNVQWLYSWASVPSRRKPERLIHTVYTGPQHLTQGSDFRRIQETLGRDLRLHYALTSPWRVFVHAGAVGWRGRAILLPGDSGSGKTTLTAALVKAGATLYSDEFAVLDRRGRVHPYPFPLRIKTDSGLRSVSVPVEELGGRAGTRPLPVGMVLATHFDPPARGGLRKGSPGKGALVLLKHANQARRRPDRRCRSGSGWRGGDSGCCSADRRSTPRRARATDPMWRGRSHACDRS